MPSLMWEGRTDASLDEVQVRQLGPVTLGVFGGCRASGAVKNEDAAVVWVDDRSGRDWTFAAVLDAHGSSDSARLVVELLQARRPALVAALEQPVAAAFPTLERELLTALTSDAFREACRGARGETALLCCATKGAFLWWFSIGDNVAYLLHPELQRLGQFALNQRQFFEWVGQVNTFEGPVPAYSRGVRALRAGRHDVLLVTDGVMECGTRPFESPGRLAEAVQDHASADAMMRALLTEVQVQGGAGQRDGRALDRGVRRAGP